MIVIRLRMSAQKRNLEDTSIQIGDRLCRIDLLASVKSSSRLCRGELHAVKFSHQVKSVRCPEQPFFFSGALYSQPDKIRTFPCLRNHQTLRLFPILHIV